MTDNRLIERLQRAVDSQDTDEHLCYVKRGDLRKTIQALSTPTSEEVAEMAASLRDYSLHGKSTPAKAADLLERLSLSSERHRRQRDIAEQKGIEWMERAEAAEQRVKELESINRALERQAGNDRILRRTAESERARAMSEDSHHD